MLVLPGYQKPQRSTPPAASKPVELFRAEEDDLMRIQVKPPGEQSYTLIRETDGFQVEGQPGFILDQEEVVALAGSLAYVEAVYVLGDSQKEQINLQDFGLDESALEIESTYKNGATLSLRIGNRIPGDEALDYCLIGDDPMLYAIHVDRKEMFNMPLRMLYTLPGINFTPDLLDSVQFESADATLSLSRLAADMWMIDRPFLYPVADAAIRQLLEGINSMRLASYVAPADSAQLALYGLDAPRTRVTFMLSASTIQTLNSDGQIARSQDVAEQTMVIEIGDPVENIGFYCRYGDSIWQASNASMGFLLKNQPKDYASRYPLGIPLSYVSRWGLRTPDEEHSYQVDLVEYVLENNEVAVDKNLSSLHNFLIRENGVEIEPEPVLDKYAVLRQIRATGDYQGHQTEPAGVPLLTVDLRYFNQDITVKFYKQDALHASIWVNGHCLHYTELAQLQNVLSSASLSAVPQ